MFEILEHLPYFSSLCEPCKCLFSYPFACCIILHIFLSTHFFYKLIFLKKKSFGIIISLSNNLNQSVQTFCWGLLLVQTLCKCFVCLFGLVLYVSVNRYGHVETVCSPNHTFFWSSLTEQLTSTSCTYFIL